MILSEVSIKRPVFALVISLLLVFFGIACFQSLTVRELPDTSQPVVMVHTVYDGANSEIVETRITDVIEGQLGGIEGIDNIRSNSHMGLSYIGITFHSDRDVDAAANDVREALARVINRLPPEADPPLVRKADDDSRPVITVNLYSDTMTRLELTDYANRVMIDRLALIDGVSTANVRGGEEYVMRIQLNPIAMSARDVTVNDVEDALRRNNIQLPAGEMTDQYRTLPVSVNRNFNTAEDFGSLAIRRDGETTVYLRDVADVAATGRESESMRRRNGVPVVALAVYQLSHANPLEVVNNVKQEIERIEPFLPEGVTMDTSGDSSIFIQAALDEVFSTLFVTVLLVIIILYVFLGNARATLVPAVTVPVSLISAFMLLMVMDYSINLITVLALILAIGLVVDDAIVVLENIHRRLDLGEPPLVAAWNGVREVGFAVIATTLVLVATFVPILFMDGVIGRLFSEYAVTLAGAVIFSSLVALTLAPMLSSKLLRANIKPTRLNRWVEKQQGKLADRYARLLHKIIARKWLGVLLFISALAATATLYPMLPQAFSPREDRGNVFMMIRGFEGTNFHNMEQILTEAEQVLLPEVGHNGVESVYIQTPGWGGNIGTNSGAIIVQMDDWADRDNSTFDVGAQMNEALAQFPGIRAFPVYSSSIGGRTQAPVQFVLGGGTFDQLLEWYDIIYGHASDHPGLTDIDIDFHQSEPRLELSIDQQRAQELGVTIEDINGTLDVLLGGSNITRFIERGEEYDVYLRASEERRESIDDFGNMYVRSRTTGELIRLDNLMTVNETGGSPILRHFGRIRAVTISANLVGNYSLGEALDYLDQLVIDHLPDEATVDYQGESRDFRHNQSSILMVFGFAMIIVYLVLAAQFESLIHPLVVMMTVPLGIAGGLLGLLLLGETLNTYSQLALIMLIGLSAKNGILIVEFANQLRDQGKAFNDAVIEAAKLRLRPIMMTSITTIMGSVPLLISVGAGAESRFSIGVVVFFGTLVSSLLTLVIVPTMYALLCQKTKSPEYVARQLDAQFAGMKPL